MSARRVALDSGGHVEGNVDRVSDHEILVGEEVLLLGVPVDRELVEK